MLREASLFKTSEKPIFCARYGSGHINQTYLVVDANAREYILQKINTKVFAQPQKLMENIQAVTSHLAKSATHPRNVLQLVPSATGKKWLQTEEGGWWRMYDFVSDSLCLNAADTPEIFKQSAIAFGTFQRQLADFDAASLTETIPNFHNTPVRYMTFKQAIKQDAFGRAAEVQREIEFALQREEYAATLVRLQGQGALPLRVTHNDTKLNNVLFDRWSRKALCVIDLDTVMPGLAANDFGDSIRFGASTAAEDEQDLSRVSFSLSLYTAYAEGYLQACKASLTQAEKEHLHDGAIMMTLECGVRFLTDYLNGDVYFATHRLGHNLDRCRTQFKLVQEMENNREKMQSIVLQQAK